MRTSSAGLALLLVGCATATLDGPGATADFERLIAGRVAGPAQTCISAQPAQSLSVVDAATVSYEIGTTIWVNRFQSNCPGLSPYNTIITERDGAQICRGDRVRGLEPGATIPGPSCNLGDWVPYARPD